MLTVTYFNTREKYIQNKTNSQHPMKQGLSYYKMQFYSPHKAGRRFTHGSQQIQSSGKAPPFHQSLTPFRCLE